MPCRRTGLKLNLNVGNNQLVTKSNSQTKTHQGTKKQNEKTEGGKIFNMFDTDGMFITKLFNETMSSCCFPPFYTACF